MAGRFWMRAFPMAVVATLLVPFFGCGSSTEVDSIAISPNTISLGVGDTVQMTAIGTIGHGSHPASSQNITTLVTWSSSIAAVATVSSSGVVTGAAAGTTTVTATIHGYGGLVTSNTAEITVTGGGGGTQTGTLASLAIIPGTQAVTAPGQTTQFIAIGTTSTGATLDITNTVAWSSSSVGVGKISATGLATAVGQGTTTITAIATNSNSTVVTATATFTVSGGTSEPFTAIAVSPGAESLSATGQTGQFLAAGTSGTNGLAQDVTNSAQVKWKSSIPSIATVTTYPASPAGLVSGVSAGTTTITAELTNPDGTIVTSSASVTVATTAAPEPLLSITILPATITIDDLLGTGQFLAYGTFSTAPTVQDITNGIDHNGFTSPVTWISGAQDIFPITSTGTSGEPGGLITAVGNGTANVYATATNPDGTLVYSPAVTFNCPFVPYKPATATSPAVLGSCNDQTIANGLLVTLTVFNAGLNTKDWLVTAPSATGTPDVIHCGPASTSGGSVCAATYPVGTTVKLTAPAGTGHFGGWSYNCLPDVAVTAAGPNSCTVTLGTTSSNVSVGAIFN